jgi:hypothetical protein
MEKGLNLAKSEFGIILWLRDVVSESANWSMRTSFIFLQDSCLMYCEGKPGILVVAAIYQK